MTMHDLWADRLSEYLDDELPDDERQEVADHLASCAECSALLRDLAAVVDAAASAPAPRLDADLWPNIASRLAPSPAARVLELPRRRYSLSVFELVAAGIVLAVLFGWTATRWLAPPPAAPVVAVDDTRTDLVVPVSLEDTAYDAAVADLERALDDGRARLDPETVRVVEESLVIIDQAIDEARHALMDDPVNEYLSDYLVETRRRKLGLLRHAATLTGEAN